MGVGDGYLSPDYFTGIHSTYRNWVKKRGSNYRDLIPCKMDMINRVM